MLNRFRLSHATVVAYLALFVALGGTAYAATSLPANSVGATQLKNGAVSTAKLHDQAVTGAKVANQALTGTQINVAKLGTVPSATHAADADQLAGSPASTYQDHCPTGLTKVPNGSLCFDFTARPPAAWIDAANTCGVAGLHLPSEGELIQVFNHLDAEQTAQWTSTIAINGTAFVGIILYSNAGRTIEHFDVLLEGAGYRLPYRCVTYASN